MIDVNEIRSLIDKHGPPLSPMLIFTLLDEIERLRAELAALVEVSGTWGGRALKAEAAIARVRELCEDSMNRRARLHADDVLIAIEGEQT